MLSSVLQMNQFGSLQSLCMHALVSMTEDNASNSQTKYRDTQKENNVTV